MKLRNLIEVAEGETAIMLTGIRSDGSEIGFDFSKNNWLDDNLFTPSRITTAGNFRLYRKYRGMRNNRIEDFSILKANTVSQFKNLPIYRGKILYVKIFLVSGKSDIQKAIDAKVNSIAFKRAKAIEAGRIEREKNKSKKKKWSFSPKKTH